MLRKINVILAIVLIIISFNYYSYAADEINTKTYEKIYDASGTSDLFTKSGKILSIVQTAGTGISLIALIVLGSKYMLSSPDEKASIKEKLIPYLIGTIIFFAATNLVAIVAKFAGGI